MSRMQSIRITSPTLQPRLFNDGFPECFSNLFGRNLHWTPVRRLHDDAASHCQTPSAQQTLWDNESITSEHENSDAVASNAAHEVSAAPSKPIISATEAQLSSYDLDAPEETSIPLSDEPASASSSQFSWQGSHATPSSLVDSRQTSPITTQRASPQWAQSQDVAETLPRDPRPEQPQPLFVLIPPADHTNPEDKKVAGGNGTSGQKQPSLGMTSLGLDGLIDDIVQEERHTTFPPNSNDEDIPVFSASAVRTSTTLDTSGMPHQSNLTVPTARSRRLSVSSNNSDWRRRHSRSGSINSQSGFKCVVCDVHDHGRDTVRCNKCDDVFCESCWDQERQHRGEKYVLFQ